jgi:hypothetical protein
MSRSLATIRCYCPSMQNVYAFQVTVPGPGRGVYSTQRRYEPVSSPVSISAEPIS